MKHQIDVFVIPIRLYIGALHNNMLGIGLNMKDVKLPTFAVQSRTPQTNTDVHVNIQQISQDSLLAYLGVRGIGQSATPTVASSMVQRVTQGLFVLGYWDAYKNYYANKQEGVGYVIGGSAGQVTYLALYNDAITHQILAQGSSGAWSTGYEIRSSTGTIPTSPIVLIATVPKANSMEKAWDIVIKNVILYKTGSTSKRYKWDESDWTITWDKKNKQLKLSPKTGTGTEAGIQTVAKKESYEISRDSIQINEFGLQGIDDARTTILMKAAEYNTPLNMNTEIPQAPYSFSYNAVSNNNGNGIFTGNASWFNQAGLGLRTFLSDRFSNWLSTEWIDGTNGINEITAIEIVDNKLSMDALILQKKIFDMLNRVAISGGSYNDWQEAVYGVKVARMAESPIYMGGASYEIVFSEVVSNSSVGEDEPLGTLAGRGVETNKKGGRSLRIKCEEPSLVMALSSYVPRVDYSQGNKWWTRLETMDDLHKPNLDAIGFQELITDEFCAVDTVSPAGGSPTYHSVGKQVSWQEYMTDVNETYGDFAVGGSLDWMAFNRAYEYEVTTGIGKVTNATTYIDPTMFNVAFANAELSAKNLWSQIAFNVTARRVMSAKQIPNL